MVTLRKDLVALEPPRIESGEPIGGRRPIQAAAAAGQSSYDCGNLHIEILDEATVPAERFQRMQQDMKQQPLVTGFNFPIADEDTVELLEATVNVNQRIREEYVGCE